MRMWTRWRGNTPARHGSILTRTLRATIPGALGMALSMAALGGALGIRPQVAHAQGLTPSVQVCNTFGGPGQLGTLGDALTQASGNDGSVIHFVCDGVITVPQTITVTSTLTITGAGHHVTLSGGHRVGVFSVISPVDQPYSVTLTLDRLTVAHGKADDGGGVLNGGELIITNSTFSDNVSTGEVGGSYGCGGGVCGGNVSITNSTFSGNSATGLGGGV